MKKSMVGLIFIIIFCRQSAYAIDQGTVQGALAINGKEVRLTHSYAHLHDNAEGLLHFPKELRIVLADREIPQSSLRGIAFLPVDTLAREDKIKGLLITLDPRDQNKALVKLLAKPSRPGQSLMTLTLSNTDKKIISNLLISNVRVSGGIEYADSRGRGDDDLPNLVFSAKFSAPLFKELPVTADLKGKAARNSIQAKVYREKIDALKKGDFEAVKRVSTERANRRDAAMLEQMGDQAKAFAKEAAEDLEKSLNLIKRVVVRGDTAVMIFSENQWATFAREGGRWKTGD
jgi:hypothetical protein